MLVNQTVSANDVITIRLISGEEIIAKFVSEESTTFTLSKPLMLANNGQAMVLTPFLMTAERIDAVPFLKTALVIPPTKTQAKVKASYIEFTTGIKTSTGGETVPPLTL